MLEKIGNFITEHLSAILGISFAGTILTIVTLTPQYGGLVFEILGQIELVTNIFPFPFNWFLVMMIFGFIFHFVFNLIEKLINLIK